MLLQCHNQQTNREYLPCAYWTKYLCSECRQTYRKEQNKSWSYEEIIEKVIRIPKRYTRQCSTSILIRKCPLKPWGDNSTYILLRTTGMMAFRLAWDDVIQVDYVNIKWSNYFGEPLCSWMHAYTYSLTQTLRAKVSVKGNETMAY